MIILRYISNRPERINDINLMSNYLFGEERANNFMQQYVPRAGRVPNPTVFTGFLINYTKFLWLIFDEENSKFIGFIQIFDLPGRNNYTGFGLHPDYSGKGIMTQCWKDAVVQFDDLNVELPLYGETSQRNTAANNFLIRNGFVHVRDTNFMGEESFLYKFII